MSPADVSTRSKVDCNNSSELRRFFRTSSNCFRARRWVIAISLRFWRSASEACCVRLVCCYYGIMHACYRTDSLVYARLDTLRLCLKLLHRGLQSQDSSVYGRHLLHLSATFVHELDYLHIWSTLQHVAYDGSTYLSTHDNHTLVPFQELEHDFHVQG